MRYGYNKKASHSKLVIYLLSGKSIAIHQWKLFLGYHMICFDALKALVTAKYRFQRCSFSVCYTTSPQGSLFNTPTPLCHRQGSTLIPPHRFVTGKAAL